MKNTNKLLVNLPSIAALASRNDAWRGALDGVGVSFVLILLSCLLSTKRAILGNDVAAEVGGRLHKFNFTVDMTFDFHVITLKEKQQSENTTPKKDCCDG